MGRDNRDIFIDKKHIKTLKGVTLSGICFRGRLVKILERLSQRKITAFDEELPVRIGPLPKIDVIGLNKYNAEAEDLEIRWN